jgi:hypothetical protein
MVPFVFVMQTANGRIVGKVQEVKFQREHSRIYISPWAKVKA